MRLTDRLFPYSLAGGLSLAALIVALLAGEAIVEQAQLAARYTARIGFPILIITYLASSLLRLWPTELTRALARNKRDWGLSFALAHTVHLGALTSYSMLAHDMPELSTFIGGGGAYVILYVMALTSNTASMRALGKNWKRLHTLGIHWLWFIFAFSYFGRLFDPERWLIGAICFPLCLAALGIRLLAWRRHIGTSA